MTANLHLSPLVLATPSSIKPLPNQTEPKTITMASSPDGFLKNCESIKELKKFHCFITKKGLTDDSDTATKLIARCSEMGTHESLSYAQKVFDSFKKENESVGTLFMYNSLIRGYSSTGICDEAILLYVQLRKAGLSPDKYTFPFVLSACAKSAAYCEGIQIHGLIMKMGFVEDLFIQNSLTHFYSECGQLRYARNVFDKMPARNVVSWTSLICGYSRGDFPKEAIDLFFEMVGDGIMPNSVTMVCVISACTKLEDLELGEKVCAFISENGVEVNALMVNALVDMYMKCGANDAAKRLFDEYTDKNLVLCNTIMSNHVHQGLAREALGILDEMIKQGLRPDRITMLSAISASSQLRTMGWGKSCHGFIIRNGLEVWDNICNALINMYMKCGKQETACTIFYHMSNKTVVSWNSLVAGYIENGEVDEAWEIFRDMPETNLVSWNTVIGALVQKNMFEEAIELFRVMQNEGIKADRVTMVSVASACGYLGALDLAKWTYYYIDKSGIKCDVRLSTALVDMFARCGDPQSAMQIFAEMTKKDVSAWTAAIGAMAVAGNGERAIELFNEMLEQGMKPDEVVFVGVLVACSHSGLIEQGRKIFGSMKETFKVSPQIVHYGCMVDLLGRAGLLEEALDLINSMPMKPNDVIWSSLLAACRVHKNVTLAAFAAEKTINLAPERAGIHVLLSNVYASAGRWNDVAKVRLDLKEKGLRKLPGSSVIEINGGIHEFTSEDKSHPEMDKIESMLDEMICRVRNCGYVPDLGNVLVDVDEQEKKFLLNWHSEKLAMAFGLISTGDGMQIRVVKNLRVCSDCHSFAKIVSKVYNREIVLRDNNRFHFFRCGLCSCGDYW